MLGVTFRRVGLCLFGRVIIVGGTDGTGWSHIEDMATANLEGLPMNGRGSRAQKLLRLGEGYLIERVCGHSMFSGRGT